MPPVIETRRRKVIAPQDTGTDPYLPPAQKSPGLKPLTVRQPGSLQGPNARARLAAGEPVNPVNWYPSMGDVLNSDVTIRTGSAGEDWRALGGLRGVGREMGQGVGAIGSGIAGAGRVLWTGSSGPQDQQNQPAPNIPSGIPARQTPTNQYIAPPIGFTGAQFPNEANLGGKVVTGYAAEPETPIITGAFARTPTGNRQYSPDQIEAIMRDPNAGRMESNIPGAVNQGAVDAAKWADYNARTDANYQRMMDAQGGSQLGGLAGPRYNLRPSREERVANIAADQAQRGIVMQRDIARYGVNAATQNAEAARQGAIELQRVENQGRVDTANASRVEPAQYERSNPLQVALFEKQYDALSRQLELLDPVKNKPEYDRITNAMNTLAQNASGQPQGQQQGQAGKRYTAAESKKLPKGTTYVGTDGVTRRT